MVDSKTCLKSMDVYEVKEERIDMVEIHDTETQIKLF